MLILWPQNNLERACAKSYQDKETLNFIFLKKMWFFIPHVYQREIQWRPYVTYHYESIFLTKQKSWFNISTLKHSIIMTFVKYWKIWPLPFSPNSTRNPDNKWRLYFVTRIDRRLNHSKTLTNQERGRKVPREIKCTENNNRKEISCEKKQLMVT